MNTAATAAAAMLAPPASHAPRLRAVRVTAGEVVSPHPGAAGPGYGPEPPRGGTGVPPAVRPPLADVACAPGDGGTP
ncbi:hypothetical protein C1J01_48285 [Nonomuraea aridisoli]|uniref:Uncharacterized protein n=1 Tax=Nonomuraea aridisoli TaxID=2070368 RepID=A0A2W2D902_9ACTN|nr:hypothetical protein C1J01_48285 [Nonomuraea aridisoli]